MLEPNSIPDKEPILRVGIILPEDKEKIVKFDFSACDGLSITADDSTIQYDKIRTLDVVISNGQLKSTEFCCSKLTIGQKSFDSYITVKDVVAGRGFHWAQKIDVKLTYKIEVKISEDNLVLINELPIEEYLACVATSEMSSQCPDAYIEAQTIAARSWMLANAEQKHVALGFDVCNDDCCQRFQGVNNLTPHSRKAAQSTKGRVLIFDEKIVDARYSKSCGGKMERFENLWENSPKEYMQNKTDAPEELEFNLTKESDAKKWIISIPETFCSPRYIKEEELHKYLGNVDVEGKYFRWVIEITQEKLVKNINLKMGLNIGSVISLKPINRAGSGRLLELEIRYMDTDAMEKTIIIHKDYEIRKLLDSKFLFSSAIIIEHTYDEGNRFPIKFIYRGAGWGHGAGMCQIGGIGMALADYKTEEILYHYYPGSELRTIYF